MNDTKEMKSFLAALKASPKDWSLRLVFSDWAEENGLDDIAGALRWMAANKKRPRWVRSVPESFIWYDYEYDVFATDPESDLPVELYNLLKDGSESVCGVPDTHNRRRVYPSREAAEVDFYQAWGRWKQS